MCEPTNFWMPLIRIVMMEPTWCSATRDLVHHSANEGMGAEGKRKKTKIIPGTQPKARAG